ncbi:hypothetical protein GF376_00405 [Candidatus Peregrinibacteria bacterium]|nr:hypothetical protein [Candidatus Peregrinibacteria bacterium]
MNNKKILRILGLTAIAANLGYSSLVFAQDSQTPEGFQTIGCDIHSVSFTTAPSSFTFPAASSSNDYQTSSMTASDSTDNIVINSNSATGCGDSVTVQVQAIAADYFYNGTVELKSQFSPESYANLSLSLDAPDCPATTCDTLDNAATTASALDGSDLYFDSSNNGSINSTAPVNAAIWLNDPSDTPHTLYTTPAITVYDDTDGFNGNLEINNVQYYIALPRAVATGTYVGTITWTLS